MADRLESTVLVVSQQVRRHGRDRQPPPRVYEQAFARPGIDPAEPRIVVVTDPGSPLRARRPRAGYRSLPRRPQRRRPLQRAVRVRPGAERRWPVSTSARLLDDAAAFAEPLGRRRRQPRPAARRGARRGRRWPAATRSCSPTSAPASRLRRLGRAADRRVHRQERHRPAAGRRGVPGRARRLRRRRPDVAPASRSARHRRTPPARSASTGPLGAQFLSGSTPPRSPAGCSASTRSTSRTSRSPRSNTAGCSTRRHGPLPAGEPALHRRRRRGPRRRRRCCRRDRRPPGRCAALLAAVPEHGYLAVMAYLDRHARRRGRAAAPRSRAARRTPSPSGGGRGSCTPPASTTRADPRRARSCRSPARSRTTSTCPTSPTASVSSRPPRPPVTGGCSADRDRPLLHLHLTDRAAGLEQLRTALSA